MKPYSRSRSLIKTSALVALLAGLPLGAAQPDLATFADPEALKSWTSVNDDVMGGISKGGFKLTEEKTLLFSGELSLENNGGFASLRTKPGELDLSGMSSIVVNARGDGRTYWVDLRVTGQMGGSSYRAYLPTSAGEWQETRIPLADFKPQAFGRELPFKAINPAEVASVGFTLADKKPGSFSLEIKSLKATDEEAIPAPTKKSGKKLVDVATAAGGFKTEEKTPSPAGLIELAISRGVPLFNSGDVAACAAIYEVACVALQGMAEVTDESRAVLAKALKAARAEPSPRNQAWILRAGLDLVSKRLQHS